jgi:hypothetical protein
MHFKPGFGKRGVVGVAGVGRAYQIKLPEHGSTALTFGDTRTSMTHAP